MENLKKNKIFAIVFIAMMAAFYVILNRFLSLSVGNIVRIGFSFVAVAMGARFFGVIGGVAVGALGDIIGAILFPSGPYFPGYTLTAAVMGLIYGLALYKLGAPSVVKAVCAVVPSQIICTLLLNTLWTSILYTKAFIPVLTSRLVQSAIMLPVQIIILVVLEKVLFPRIEKMLK